MSLAVLKRKTLNGNPRMAPISGQGSNGFSLVGTHRNIGNIGQFRMVSNVTRTRFRGAEPMGNGGCCGAYNKNASNSGSCCTNSNAIVKKTVKNTAGMIEDKYMGTLHGAYSPNKATDKLINWVQNDDSSYRVTADQSQFISKKTQAAGACAFDLQNTLANNPIKPCSANVACSYHIGGKKYIRMPYAKDYFKGSGAKSQSIYITAGGVGKNNCLPTPANRGPFPMRVTHNGCDVTAKQLARS